MSIANIMIAAVGAVYVLFAPGLALSFAFFKRRTIDLLERAALSFALSIAVVPLVAFYLNLVGVKLTRLSVVLEVAFVIAAGGGVAWWRHRRGERPKPPEAKPSPPKPSLDPVRPRRRKVRL